MSNLCNDERNDIIKMVNDIMAKCSDNSLKAIWAYATNEYAGRPLTVVTDVVDDLSANDAIMQTPLHELGLSGVPYGRLKYEVETVEELITYSRLDLLNRRGLGKLSVDEIEAKLKERGLRLSPHNKQYGTW